MCKYTLISQCSVCSTGTSTTDHVELVNPQAVNFAPLSLRRLKEGTNEQKYCERKDAMTTQSKRRQHLIYTEAHKAGVLEGIMKV